MAKTGVRTNLLAIGSILRWCSAPSGWKSPTPARSAGVSGAPCQLLTS